MPSPRLPASRSIRPQAKPPCGRFQRASPAGPAPPGGLRPPPSPRELPRPRWAETFSLPANLAFGVSQKPKPPLCKGRRREAPEGSFWDRLQLFQNDGSVTAPPTQGSLREPFRICHDRLFQYAKPPAIGPGVYSHCGCPVERGREEGLSPSSGKWRRRKRR